MIKRLLLTCMFSVCVAGVFAQEQYPDDNLPGDVPQLFAKGLLTDGLSNRDFTISPKGDEIYFTVQQKRFASFILKVAKVNGVWDKPEMAPFSGVYRDLEAAFSADGNTLFFASDRPLMEGGQPKPDFDIWKTTRGTDGKWGQPVNLGPTVNTGKDEYYPSVAKNGNLYFTVEAAYGKGSEDIVVCKSTPTGYAAPESLPEAINTKFGEFNAFVDPDEQFIIFSSEGRPGSTGGDLYMSKKDKAGNWTAARQLPAPINSTGLDYCPYVTADKKYFIFSSNRLRKEWYTDKAITYDEMKSLVSEPGNGLDDIYWVKFNPDW